MLRSSEGRIVIAAVALLLLAIALLLPGKTLTGFVVYRGDLMEHDFAFDGMIYNSSAINASADELKLNLITETKSYDTEEREIVKVLYAFSGSKEKTNEIKAIDGNSADISKNDRFDVTFEDIVFNNSIIQLYLLNSDATEIYLCNISHDCSSPGYGSRSYDGNRGWYNITLSGLNEPKSGFNIDPVIKVKYDFVRAINKFNMTHYYNTSYYPLQAAAETADFAPASLYSWDRVVADDDLNGQSIEYYYSTDSGSTWEFADDNDISSANASAGKISIMALITGNGIETPVIRKISVTYFEKIECNPEWSSVEAECQANDTRFVYYNDLNMCNTTENLPIDNGTYIFCDFCAPEWEEVNTTCLPDDTINQYFMDLNSCYWQTYLESDNNPPGNNTFSCDYCVPLLLEQNTSCYGSEILSNYTTYYDDINDCYGITGLVSDITPPNITNACPSQADGQQADGQESDEETAPLVETLIEYPEKGLSLNAEADMELAKSSIAISEVDIDVPQTLKELYTWNITADSSIKSNISSISLRFYYNDTLLDASDINESTLGIYYYDEQYKEFEDMPSIINITGDYVEADITHLSVYGLYGRQNLIEEAVSQASQPESGGKNSYADSQSSAGEGSLPEEPALNPDMGALSSEEKDAAADEGSDEGKTADTPANNENELSLSPYYEYDKGAEQNSTFDIIGRIIRRNREKNYINATTIGIFWFLMLVTYLLVQVKKRKKPE